MVLVQSSCPLPSFPCMIIIFFVLYLFNLLVSIFFLPYEFTETNILFVLIDDLISTFETEGIGEKSIPRDLIN